MTNPRSNQDAFHLSWPVRHPRATVGLTVLCVLVSLGLALRMRADASLKAMFPQSNASTHALQRVMEGFTASESLLVLVTLPEEGGQTTDESDARRLGEFAGRLKAVLTQSPEAKDLVETVTYAAPASVRAYAAEVVAPNLVYFLDEAGLAKLRQRLMPQAMAEQLARNEALLAVPGVPSGVVRLMLKDPLRLSELAIERFASLLPAGASGLDDEPGLFLSSNRRSLLVQVGGTQPVSDMDYVKRLMPAVRRAVRAADPQGLQIDYAGGYAIAETAEASIRRDMIVNAIGTTILLQILFLLAYRNLWSFAIVFAPVVTGIVVGFGAHALVWPTLTPATAVIGGMLAGLGIDYSIHFLSGSESDPEAYRMGVPGALLAALTHACATSVIAFLVIALSDVQALRDFALLGALGLTGSFLAAALFLPALAQWGRPRRGRFGPRPWTNLQPALEAIARHPGRFRAAGLVLLAAAAAVVFGGPGPILQFESDLHSMHPRPNRPLEVQAQINQRFSMAMDQMIVYLKAESPQRLVEAAHRVDAALRHESLRSQGVTGSLSIASLLPDPSVVAQRRQWIRTIDADRVVTDFRAAVGASAFDPADYQGYEAYLRRLLNPGRPPTLADLVRYPDLCRLLLPRSALAPPAQPAQEALSLVLLEKPVSTRRQRETVITGIRNRLKAASDDGQAATLTGMSVIAHDTELIIRRDLARLAWVAGGLVAVYLLLVYRSVRHALQALVPMVFGTLMLLATMRLAGIRFNLMNLVALPLLAGIGVDYGVFFVSAARAVKRRGGGRSGLVRSLGHSAQAVVVCALTTMLGFGSLVTTSTPAIASVGIVLCIGVAACMLGVLLFTAPMLLEEAKDGGVSQGAQGFGNPRPHLRVVRS